MAEREDTDVRHVYSGVYQHYKEGLYLVLGLAIHTETGENLIVYVPLYTQEDHKGPRIQVRPVEMFFEDVEVNGVKQPRFQYLGPELT